MSNFNELNTYEYQDAQNSFFTYNVVGLLDKVDIITCSTYVLCSNFVFPKLSKNITKRCSKYIKVV